MIAIFFNKLSVKHVLIYGGGEYASVTLGDGRLWLYTLTLAGTISRYRLHVSSFYLYIPQMFVSSVNIGKLSRTSNRLPLHGFPDSITSQELHSKFTSIVSPRNHILNLMILCLQIYFGLNETHISSSTAPSFWFLYL